MSAIPLPASRRDELDDEPPNTALIGRVTNAAGEAIRVYRAYGGIVFVTSVMVAPPAILIDRLAARQLADMIATALKAAA